MKLIFAFHIALNIQTMKRREKGKYLYVKTFKAKKDRNWVSTTRNIVTWSVTDGE